MTQDGVLRGIAVRDQSRAPMQERDKVEVTVESGIVEDYRGTGLRQVTFLSAEQWEACMQELRVSMPWHTRRANLLVEGVDLFEAIGQRLQVGTCVFDIHGETDPCQRMDELQAGLRETLTPDLRAGVWGRVVEGGTLEIGHSVRVLD